MEYIFSDKVSTLKASAIREIFKILYEDSTIYMERKYEIFKGI